jgi:outer membrane murein-binding lipoprotein Lpp
MKFVASMLFASVLLFGCENDSKLDGAVGKTGGGDLEARVAKLEAENAKYKEALDFLQKVYNDQKKQQQQQQAQQEEQEPDPSAQFAVDITPDIKGGQVEGPNSACVTVVEAWDFA